MVRGILSRIRYFQLRQCVYGFLACAYALGVLIGVPRLAARYPLSTAQLIHVRHIRTAIHQRITESTFAVWHGWTSLAYRERHAADGHLCTDEEGIAC